MVSRAGVAADTSASQILYPAGSQQSFKGPGAYFTGHVINVSSVYGHKVVATGAVYCATKHAVRAISEGLREEVKDYNIRVATISPGAVRTELTDHITEPGLAEDVKGVVSRSACRPAPWPVWSRSRSPSRTTLT